MRVCVCVCVCARDCLGIIAVKPNDDTVDWDVKVCVCV